MEDVLVWHLASLCATCYTDYPWAALEPEKEEAMEPSCNHPVASANKSQAISFFPLQKFRGSQPTTTPSVWVAHLEEESANMEKCIDNKDPDNIEHVTEEFIVCLARVVKDEQQEESGVTTAAAQITLSMIAHWWQYLEQTCM